MSHKWDARSTCKRVNYNIKILAYVAQIHVKLWRTNSGDFGSLGVDLGLPEISGQAYFEGMVNQIHRLQLNKTLFIDSHLSIAK